MNAKSPQDMQSKRKRVFFYLLNCYKKLAFNMIHQSVREKKKQFREDICF